MKIVRLVVLIGCLLLVIPAAAQADTPAPPPCTPDLSAVRDLLDQVDAATSAGTTAETVALLTAARDQLDTLLDACTPRPVVNLAEQVAIRDGQVTLNYPANWLRRVDLDSADGLTPTYIQFASSVAVFDSAGSSPVPVLTAGQQLIVLIAGAPAAIVSGSSLAPSAPSLLASYRDTVGASADAAGFRFGEITTLTIGDRDAAQMDFNDATFEARVYAVELEAEQMYVILLALSAPGELANLTPTVEAMAASLQYDPGVGVEPTVNP